MNENESADAESAYGSEISSNSDFILKKETFKIEERTPKSQTRWKWLQYKLREYMILEAIFFFILVFLLITCYRITSQNQETQRMILSLQSQLNSVEKQIGKDYMNTKKETGKGNKNESEKTKEMPEEGVKEAIRKPNVQFETSQTTINITSKPKETPPSPTISTVSLNSIAKQFNAASLIAKASIDTSLSSSSSLNPLIGFDQSSLVLVDRPEPPADKAWCTSDRNPVLTVTLGYYINPTAVSYQHSKWSGTIPDDAPKEYSVEACLDNHCINRKPLFSNCEYNQNGLQEQICNNSPNDSINSPVAKLQFRFQKNHGNTERTCVSLVRVYSESELVKKETFRRLKDTTTCLDLNNYYHNNPMIYKFFTHKHCSLLYSKGCCQECPECCEECEIQDFNPEVTPKIIMFVIFGVLFGIPIFLIFLLLLCAFYLKVVECWSSKFA